MLHRVDVGCCGRGGYVGCVGSGRVGRRGVWAGWDVGCVGRVGRRVCGQGGT